MLIFVMTVGNRVGSWYTHHEIWNSNTSKK